MNRGSRSLTRINTHPERDALRNANRERDGAALAKARDAWIARFGEGALLAWAVEHMSLWAVDDLVRLGEPVNKITVVSALNKLDCSLAWGIDDSSEEMAMWELFLPTVEASLELRRVAVECVLRRQIPSVTNERSQLPWVPLKMDRVFQADLLEALFEAPLPLGGLELIGGLGKDAPPPCYLTPLQIAWDQGRPDLCLALLQQGLSVQACYADSLWPTWTLERAVLAPGDWVATLTGDAEARACEALNAYHKAGPNPTLEILARTIRERLLDQSMPAPVPFTRSPRF